MEVRVDWRVRPALRIELDLSFDLNWNFEWQLGQTNSASRVSDDGCQHRHRDGRYRTPSADKNAPATLLPPLCLGQNPPKTID
jgi:hypothetical protein